MDKEQFSEIFKYNFFYSKIEEDNNKYQEVLSFLTACIIEKCTESDLLRYFLPQSLSQKENKPEYSDHASRISHWFQLIGYWFRQLFNKPIYQLNSESNLLADSVKQLKTALNQRSYVDNSVDVDFRAHLSQVLIQLEKKLINSQVEERANEGIIERERAIARREEILSQLEVLLSEKLDELARINVSLQEKTELLSEDRQEIEKQNKELVKEIEKLKETISDLKKEKFSEKTYIHLLETGNFQHEKDLEELIKYYDDVFSQGSLSKAKSEESIASFYSVLEAIEPDQEVQTNAEPKLYRCQSFTSFFSEQPAKNSNSNLSTTKSLECLIKSNN